MSEPNRIDPAAIPALFRELGIKPLRNRYTLQMDGAWIRHYQTLGLTSPGEEGECLACLMGVVAAEAHGFDRVRHIHGFSEAYGELAGLGYDYSDGLDDGWEDKPRCTFPWADNEDYQLGLDHGRKAYRACLDAGLTIPRA